jgi:ParG
MLSLMTRFKLSDIIRPLSRFLNVSEEKQVSYRMFLSESLRARFKSICALKQVSMNEILIKLVEDWLKQNENQSPANKEDKGAA